MEQNELNPEEFKENKFKKIILLILTIALIALVLSLTFFSWGNDSLILGLIDSTIIKDNKMEVGNITLEFDAEIYNELVNHYKINEGKEIKVCLLGEQNETHILINDLFYPKISSQSYNHVTSKICPKKTIISLHSQPNRQCLPSDQDIESLKYLKQYNENVLVAIMCEEKRFNFYS